MRQSVVVIDDGAPTNEPVAYGAYDGIDTATQAIIDQENDRVKEEMGVVLGTTPFFLDGEREPGVRTQETNLGDFCADAFRWAAEKELAIEADCSSYLVVACDHTVPDEYAESQGRITIVGLS